MDDREETPGDARTLPASAKCPICGKPATPKHRPFCSKRCADIDLGRWLKGVYAVPTDEPADGEPEERDV
jgi:endogenous inhibitor of DNA gyrase (YacG/DUF329 family)